MSTTLKINAAVWSVILSCVGTASYVVWIASAKARDVEVQGQSLSSMESRMDSVESMQSRLDERTQLILQNQKTQDSKLHGIATQLGIMSKKLD
jgi:DNA-directed RNA polymerase specialized sigma subunit